MATTLAAQLAKIRANAVNPLDLKAQKRFHSQSLLFDARNAATQDFDTIHQICVEGFNELCNLDARFTNFARNLFSEQSKLEDRSQMTVAQNEQLDDVLEDCLGLLGSKLLLKPALKALEWLIRRFRVHEKNTLCLVLTFLPHNTAPIFTTMIDILPPNLPQVLNFLHPYIQSRANPPRHIIVYTAAHNQAFFAAINTYTLKVSRKGHNHPTLLSFWATVTTEAVAAMVNQSNLGRHEAQIQRQEDVMLRVIPFLNEGLSLGDMPDLRAGCYMILTVLASQIDLGSEVLSTMMESIVLGWDATIHAGLISLAVLTQQKKTLALPRKVFKALMAVEKLDKYILALEMDYKAEKLVLGVLLGIIDGIEKAKDANTLVTFRSLIEASLMNESLVMLATNLLLSAAHSSGPLINQHFDPRGALGDLILRLADSSVVGDTVKKVIKDCDVDIEKLETSLQRVVRPIEDGGELLTKDVKLKDVGDRPTMETFDAVLKNIPTRTANEISFLSHSDSYVFPSLVHAFQIASFSPKDVSTFSDLAVFRKSFALTDPLFVSFFIKVWCGSFPAIVRGAAIDVVTDYFRKQKQLNTDIQVLLPYIIYALADPWVKVRRASAELILILDSRYEDSTSIQSQDNSESTILGRQEIYGQGSEAKEVSWMTVTETAKFVHDLLTPSLEECVLDSAHLPSRLSDTLNGPRHAKDQNNTYKELKTSLRTAIFSCLCSHVVNTPLYAVKDRLLQILNRVSKVGSISRTKLLLPLLEKCMAQSQPDFEALCMKQDVSCHQLIEQIIGIVTPSDRDGLRILQNIMQTKGLAISPLLHSAAMKHVQKMWALLKPDVQTSLAKTLLGLALDESEAGKEESQQSEALEVLRSLDFPTVVLHVLLEELPVLFTASGEKPSASKRRRTNYGHTQVATASDSETLKHNFRKICFVLELIEMSTPERHHSLLRGLFQLLTEIQHSINSTGIGLGYPQSLTLSNILAIVKEIESSSTRQIDRSAVRADVLIDYIRTTKTPQVQNTALLLISSLATVAPDLILHSVMPVFTYMGANVLSQNDEYSAYVVRQTIQSVVPRLVHSLHKLKGDPLVGVSELLLSFVAAFEHIPSQRRFGLFTSLAEKLDPNKYLFAMLIVLKDKYPNDKKVAQFAVELTSHHEVKTQFLAVERYLDVILDTFNSKPILSSSLVSRDNGRTSESIVANLLSLPSLILSTQRLTSKTAKILSQQKEENESIPASYGRLLEQTFILSEKTKHSSKLQSLCEQLLHALLGLCSLSEFVRSLQILLSRTDHEIRRQGLKSLERRLNNNSLKSRTSQHAMLALLPQLSALIGETFYLPLKHTAVVCIDRIIEEFGKIDISMVITIAATIASPACLGMEDSMLRVIALLCLATTVEIAKEAFVPVIPQALSKAMDYLATSINSGVGDEPLHNAAYSFTSKLIKNIPYMVSGPYLDQLLTSSHESANAELGEDCDRCRIDALNLVATQLEPKQLFASLDRTWTSAMTEGPLAVKEHLLVLRLSISHQPKTIILKYSSDLVTLFLKCFDLRRIQFSPKTEDSYEEDEVEEVEAAVNETVIAMIYRLNDAHFRPLFLQMMEWATPLRDNKSGNQRRLTWWMFLRRFFDTLKSIVTNYASFIIDNAVEILDTIDLNDPDSRLLWRQVVLTLQKCFEHDQDEFWQSPTHFTPISSTLLASLPAVTQLIPPNQPKDNSLPTLLTETITALAATTADAPSHHRSLNSKLLSHLRSESAAVRLLAARCERALTNRLGEEWLGMLPEMLPIIAEGLEDDDESVEAEVRGWVTKIEEVLGEKLDDMLK